MFKFLTRIFLLKKVFDFFQFPYCFVPLESSFLTAGLMLLLTTY